MNPGAPTLATTADASEVPTIAMVPATASTESTNATTSEPTPAPAPCELWDSSGMWDVHDGVWGAVAPEPGPEAA